MFSRKDQTREPALAEGPAIAVAGALSANATWSTSSRPADVDRGRGFTPDR